MSNIVLECIKVQKAFFDGDNTIQVLSGVNLIVEKNQKIAIMGRSGSGKTTLLQLLGGLDVPTKGTVNLCPKIGFIYQMHHLLAEFTALENVCMPLLIKNMSLKAAKMAATNLLEELGLGHRLQFKPRNLSGGERQRVAIARALINQPDCILADEPTGNLDAESATTVIDLICNLNTKYHTAVIMVTHDLSLAQRFDRIYQLQHGELLD